MGKIFSRLFRSSASKTQRTAYAETCFDNISRINHNKTVMANKACGILNETNNFNEFDNILNVNCSTNSSICMFGQADYTVQLFDFSKNKKIKSWKGHEKDVTRVFYFIYNVMNQFI